MYFHLRQPRAFRVVSKLPQLFTLSLIFLSTQLTLAQQCYYPDGSPSKEQDGPCSSDPGAACCPLNWQCLSNGLCYLENQGYIGRYTCTDQTWQSCGNNICTHGLTASGNEAILLCSSGNYCCDANRPTVGCCDTGASQFPLPQGSIIASIGSVAPPSSPTTSSAPPPPSPSLAAPTTSSPPPPPSSSSPPQSLSQTTIIPSELPASSAAASSSSLPATSFVVITTIVTNTAGSSTTVTNTAALTTQSATLPLTPTPGPSSPNIGAIVGGVLGGVALLLAALLIYCLRRRRRNREGVFVSTPADLYTDTPYTYGQKPELPGSPVPPHINSQQPVGLGLAASKHLSDQSTIAGQNHSTHVSNRGSELDGTPISPAVPSEMSGDSPVPQRYEERIPFLGAELAGGRGSQTLSGMSQASTVVPGQPVHRAH